MLHQSVHEHVAVPVAMVEKYRSCVLNIADEGPRTGRDTGPMLGMSPQAVSQSEQAGVRRMKRSARARVMWGESESSGDRVGAMLPDLEGL